MRATLNVLATVAGEWLRMHVPVEWVDRYDKRFEAFRLPKGKAERQQYAQVIGADGLVLLSTIYSDQAPAFLREIPMVQILRQVWVQRTTPARMVKRSGEQTMTSLPVPCKFT